MYQPDLCGAVLHLMPPDLKYQFCDYNSVAGVTSAPFLKYIVRQFDALLLFGLASWTWLLVRDLLLLLVG